MKIPKMLKNPLWAILGSGIAITLLTVSTYVFKPAYVNILEYKLYDAFFQKVHSKTTTQSVVIVDIDEYSLEKFGQWPWPRYRVALLLQKIKMAGALSVGVDILFAEPDATSLHVLKQSLKRDLHIDVEFSGMPPGLMDNDQLFATVLQTGPYVLGYSFAFETMNPKPNLTLPPPLAAVEIKGRGAQPAHTSLFEAAQVIAPLPVFLQSVDHAGFMNTLTDEDGVLRRTPLFMSWQGQLYPQLSLATLLAAFQDKIPDPIIKVTQGGIESIKIGNTIVPLQSNGALLINYRGPSHTFPYISAGKILEDQVNQKALEGKIVFLGTSAAGLKDLRVSPLDQVFPGVEIHATIADNILSNDFIHRPDWTPGLELGVILFWGVITTVLIGWASPVLTLPITLALGLGVLYGGVWALDQMNIWVSPFFPMAVLIINFSILNMLKFWFSERKKRFFRSAFSKYVSKAVVDQLAENPEKLSLEGEEKDVSILFSDIRGFTTLSETLSPAQVTLLLHDYFTPVTQIIINNHGTHDKFIGDAVMCFWNAPVDVKNHQGFAIKAALEILDSLQDLNKGFQEKFGVHLEIGIGLHSGQCRVGNMGSDDIFDYTIIGDNVNLASRLEGLTKFYGVSLIVSETMLKEIGEGIVIQELDLVRVKGKERPVQIYTVHRSQKNSMDQRKEEMAAYSQGLSLYKNRAFDKGEEHFKELAAHYSDNKLYLLYQERCAAFVKNPPDENWEGVFTHKSK